MGNPSLDYLAGYFDGEGSISITNCGYLKGRRTTPSYVLTLSVTSTQMAILQELKLRFGGRVYHQRKPTGARKECWAWMASSKVAMNFLETIHGKLILKAAEADVALRYQRRLTAGGKKRWNRWHPPDEAEIALRVKARDEIRLVRNKQAVISA